jgi:hypothetical protein
MYPGLCSTWTLYKTRIFFVSIIFKKEGAPYSEITKKRKKQKTKQKQKKN